MTIFKEEKYRFPLGILFFLVLAFLIYLGGKFPFVKGIQNKYLQNRKYRVMVKGPVKYPGLYQFDTPPVLTNVIEKAGGLKHWYVLRQHSNRVNFKNHEVLDVSQFVKKKYKYRRWYNDRKR